MPEEARIRVVAVDDDEAILDMYPAGLAKLCEVKTFLDPKKAKEFLTRLLPRISPT